MGLGGVEGGCVGLGGKGSGRVGYFETRQKRMKWNLLVKLKCYGRVMVSNQSRGSPSYD